MQLFSLERNCCQMVAIMGLKNRYTPSLAEAEFDVLTAGFGTIQLCL